MCCRSYDDTEEDECTGLCKDNMGLMIVAVLLMLSPIAYWIASPVLENLGLPLNVSNIILLSLSFVTAISVVALVVMCTQVPCCIEPPLAKGVDLAELPMDSSNPANYVFDQDCYNGKWCCITSLRSKQWFQTMMNFKLEKHPTHPEGKCIRGSWIRVRVYTAMFIILSIPTALFVTLFFVFRVQ
jgi:hypothetical protein